MWLRNWISIIRKAKKWGLEKKNLADRGYYAKNWKFKWKPKIMALPRIFKAERELELWINWWLDAAPWIFFWWWLWFELSYLQLARESKDKSNFLTKSKGIFLSCWRANFFGTFMFKVPKYVILVNESF